MRTPNNDSPETTEGIPADIPMDDCARTVLPGMRDVAALAGGWRQARERLSELGAAPELIVGVADAILGLAVTLDAYIRSAVPSSVLLSYRAAEAAAMAKTGPMAALVELTAIVDLGGRATDAVLAGKPQTAAEILSAAHGQDIH